MNRIPFWRRKQRTWENGYYGYYDNSMIAVDTVFYLGNENDEILATILRGLLSKEDGYSLQKVVLPESGRVGYKLYVSSSVTMDSNAADVIIDAVAGSIKDD